MLSLSDYGDQDGVGLAQLVDKGEISRVEVIDAAMRACEAVNPRLNAIVLPLFDMARRNEAIGSGPLNGAPIVLKDEYQSVAGVATSQSARLAKGWTRDYDTEIVARYRRAGLQIVGKANLPEFGASVTTEPVLTGATNNPWDLARNTGGSSGGSAAAVAAGIVPLAYATDGAGSIRIPASCCGVFGLKPSRGRTPTGPDGYEYWNGLCIEHAITRSVRDSAALLDATDGMDLGAPYAAPAKSGPFLDEVGAPPGRLRIGITAAAPTGAPVHRDCVAALEDAAELCRSLGHIVEPATPTYDALSMEAAMKTLLAVHLALGVDDLGVMMGRTPGPDLVERSHWALHGRGRETSAPVFLDALETLGRAARAASRFWLTYDVWLTPTLARPPLPHGTISADDADVEAYLAGYFNFIPFTPLANVTGNPAMSVPLFWNAGGLPIGAHFTGRFGDEQTLFRLAGQLEEARPWAARRPPVSVWVAG
jgi:amidase